MNQQTENIVVPRKLFSSMIEAYQKWEKVSDEFEDFLLANDKEFIAKMEKARKEDMAGGVHDISKLERELGI